MDFGALRYWREAICRCFPVICRVRAYRKMCRRSGGADYVRAYAAIDLRLRYYGNLPIRQEGSNVDQTQYGSMRFAKYEGAEIGNIEADHERPRKNTSHGAYV